MSNLTDMKQYNRMFVIQAIHSRNAVSKSDIADYCGITYVTAHSIVQELVQKGACLENGSAHSGGRKKALYSINNSFCYILGLELYMYHIYISIHDFGLNLVYEEKKPCDPTDVNRTILLIIKCLEEAIDASNVPRDFFLGIGIAFPGRIDQTAGRIVNIPKLVGWNNVYIEKIISKKMGLPVFIENDINVRLLAQKWDIGAENATDMILMTITEGIGAGVISGGRLLQGAHSYVTEIGHTTLQYDGRLCGCGSRGCIETFISNQAIIEKTLSLIGSHSDAELHIQDIIEAAKGPDGGRFYEVFLETSKFIGLTIEHLIKIYDPAVILIENDWLGEFPEIFELMTENLFEKCVWLNSSMIDIRLINNKDYWKSAMASLVLEKIFNYNQNNFINTFFSARENAG